MDIYSNNYDHNNNQYSKYAQVSTFATSSEPSGNPSTRLPPKMLHKRSRLRNFLVHLAIALAACAMFAIAVMYGVTGHYFAVNQKSDNTDNSCDKQAASTTEQRFVIDIRLGGSFSFAHAKLIDVTWDLLVGQGGRFLHAWLLYQYIVPDTLVWTMERSAVPCRYFTSLSFSTVSLSSLWSLIKILGRRPGLRTILSALWLVFAIAYVLAFPTIWSAATGYISPSVRMYQMPDHTLASLDSDLLALCWSIRDDRVDGMAEGYLEMGPTFKQIDVQRRAYLSSGFDFSSTTTDVWWSFNLEGENPNIKTSTRFRDLYAYGMSTRDVQRFLNGTGAARYAYDVALTGPAVSDSYNMEDPSQRNSSGEVIGSRVPLKGLPRVLTGWQYTGIGQKKKPLREYEEDWPINMYAAKFSLDESISSRAPGIVPYNSTLWYGNRSYPLSAPFLSLGDGCSPHSGFYSSLGSCVCYRDKPISYDWYSNDNMSCVSRKGYAWGFSSFLVLVALIIEGVWAIGCWGLWLDANVNSVLLKRRRRVAGVVRSALDLAESVNRDLGTGTCAYPEKELSKALDRCDDIGYSIDDRSEIAHIGLVPESLKQRSYIYGDKHYG